MNIALHLLYKNAKILFLLIVILFVYVWPKPLITGREITFLYEEMESTAVTVYCYKRTQLNINHNICYCYTAVELH